MTTVALFGAAGKVGTCITDAIRGDLPICCRLSYGKSVSSELGRAIRQGQAVSPTAAEGLRVLRIIEAIYRPAAEGQEIAL
jgi:hypothetical protein